MNKLFLCLITLMCTGCTYSINMVHSQGEATDLIDETQSNEPDVSPTITIPVSPV